MLKTAFHWVDNFQVHRNQPADEHSPVRMLVEMLSCTCTLGYVSEDVEPENPSNQNSLQGKDLFRIWWRKRPQEPSLPCVLLDASQN